MNTVKIIRKISVAPICWIDSGRTAPSNLTLFFSFQDFTLDFYMRQTWQDPRLAFGSLDLGLSKEIDSLTVGVDYLDRLWKPDTFFPNEKKSFFHLATTHNSFLRIEGDGTVYTSQRLVIYWRNQLIPFASRRGCGRKSSKNGGIRWCFFFTSGIGGKKKVVKTIGRAYKTWADVA